jgi:uncharacterized protein involved in outer membrane biogenesis
LRDILTIIASIVILILAAAVVAPPFIDWEAHRALIDQAVSRAVGTQAKTEGRIRLRLLPSPLVRLERLRLGPAENAPTLKAEGVRAELALMPLLQGTVRFTDARVENGELKIPVGPDGRWQLPPIPAAAPATPAPGSTASGQPVASQQKRGWEIDKLLIDHLLVTRQVTSTGRTDQFFAENVEVEAQKLTGPWRIEGMAAGIPFRFGTGELGDDRTIQVKLSGGGDVHPRFEIDGKLDLNGFTGSDIPSIAGKAKLLFGPPAQAAAAGIPIPIAVDTTFKTKGSAVDLEAITVDAGEGSASLRLTGSGDVQVSDPRIRLKLEGRRLDADSFLVSANGQSFMSRLQAWSLPTSSVPVDLDLSLSSIGLAQDELTNAVLKATVVQGRAQVQRLEFLAPGDTRVALEGEVGIDLQGGASGRATVASKASDRLGRYLAKFRVKAPFLKVLDGRPFEAASDFSVSLPVTSLRNLRVQAGDAVLTGNLRYTEPEGGSRGKLEAQVAVQGLNLDQLPQVSSLFDATENLDVGFILDARDVRAGNQRGGRVSARILSDGPALVVETLEITDLAGANARVSGRIAPDGSGRIAGKVTARRAAPLVDLLGSVWIGGVSKLVPSFLREGDLNLDIVTERAAQNGSAPLRLRTTAKGTAAGGGFEGEVVTVDGAAQNLDVRLATDNTGRWINRPDLPILRRPSQVALQGTRGPSGAFNVSVSGDMGGVQIATARPFALSPSEELVDSGEMSLTSPDITPFLALLGDGATVQPPVPLQARLTLGRDAEASQVVANGQVAGSAFEAQFALRSRNDVNGNITLDSLSLPWFLNAFALNAPAGSGAGQVWSTARFGQSTRLIGGGRMGLSVNRLGLGRGLEARDAAFLVDVTPEGLSLRNLKAAFAGGQIAGSLSITRQGSLASVTGEGTVTGVPLAALDKNSRIAAQLAGTLKFGAAAETLAGLIANLGGAGELRVTDLSIPNGDPAALDRALKRLLADEDPLAVQRVETVVAEELSRGAFRTRAVSSPVALVGGTLRLSPFVADGGPALWQGSVAYDLKSLLVEARGTLVSKATPSSWTGSAPAVGLDWRGPLSDPNRSVEAGLLRNGLAAIVLQRELEKIEAFEADANERLRRRNRLESDRQREKDRRAAEEAAQQARLRDEEARMRAEAEKARSDAERIQEEQRRSIQEQTPPPAQPNALPLLGPPIDIRPAPQIEIRPGG